MLIPALFLWILNIYQLCSGQNYMDYYKPGDTGTEAPVLSDDQPSLQSVTNVDELLKFLYPEYDLLQYCLRKKSWHASSPSPAFLPSSVSPSVASSDDDLWGSPRKGALYKADDTLGVVLDEIQRTLCQPREVCVEVAKEYPESTSQFSFPRCVALHRCGGCCANEAHYCTNTSYTLVNKTLLEVSPPRMKNSYITVAFVNHTSCLCFSKRPLHSIIRRATTDNLCPPPDVPCAAGLVWDEVYCMCIPADTMNYSDRETVALDSGLLALCGPNRVLKDASCECVCRNGLTEASCGAGWKLDSQTCECQCDVPIEDRWCPAGQRWDEKLCSCVCAVECPRNKTLNPNTCLCQCRENHQSCLLQGMRFNPVTCSCFRYPCRTPIRVCQAGFYYNQKVCQCIPEYMRPEWD